MKDHEKSMKYRKHSIIHSQIFLFFYIQNFFTRYVFLKIILLALFFPLATMSTKISNFSMFLSFFSRLLFRAGSQSGVISPTSTSSQQNPTQLRMPPPTQGGINEPQECPYCRRTFSCYYSLKRHFQDKHEQSDTLYVCEFCHRRYRTKNSLTTHKSLQHRGSSGMLKRLLKTSAIKNVLGSHVSQHSRPHLFDFAAELGQPPPPGIPQ